MIFDDKVKLLRTLPQFKVAPISEIRAVAFAIKEKSELETGDILISKINPSTLLTLNQTDIEKIIRVYPNLKEKL